MTEQNKDNRYKTHWHSFWFGFMTALSIALFVLLIGIMTDSFTFKQLNFNTKKTVSIKTTTDSSQEPTNSIANLSFDDVLAKMNITKEDFDVCMEDEKFAQAVQDDFDSGSLAGVQGTPHSFVFIDDAIYEIPGAYDEAGMRDFFDDLLAGNEPKATDLSGQRDILPINEDDWVQGNPDARITIIEYSDLDCPFCKDFHKATYNIMPDYSDDIKWVFRHMPIDQLHPDARAKAQAAECIGNLGGANAFFEFIDGSFRQ